MYYIHDISTLISGHQYLKPTLQCVLKADINETMLFCRFNVPALTCAVCRTKVRLMIAVIAEFLRHFFVFHLVDHLSLSMTGALKCVNKTGVLLKNSFPSTIQIIVIYVFWTAMGEKFNRFLREQTPHSLRPVDRLKVNGLSWKKGKSFVPRRAKVF